jgi:asparagine synthase (glutamine-hydrolysing)
MCGIFAIFNSKGNYLESRAKAVRLLKRLRHRGPEYTGIEHFEVGKDTHTFLCHERLAIVDPENGHQPQFSREKNFCCVTNGEIYNHKDILAGMKGYENLETNADCLIVPNMFEYYLADPKLIANMLSGMFAVICYDVKNNRFWVLRDHVGIVPTYLGRGKGGEFYVSNELKSFHDVTSTVEILLPGI